MKVICIGNYPPRQCGIATFTENLVQSILKAASLEERNLAFEVIAMNDAGQEYSYPAIVSATIPDKLKKSYIETAEYINQSGADVCLLQHEYGIYGGESGLLLLALLRRVTIPIVSTLHTVLQKPSFHQKEVLKKIAFYSTKIVVMNSLAIDFLEQIYEIQRDKIVQIQHGVPDFEAFVGQLKPKPIAWENRKVMLTFGLIGRSKGIETVIRALPAIISKHPEVLYVVLGKTHPNIIRYAGEEYREFLKSLVVQFELNNHVVFMDQYVSEIELMSYLRAADIYVTPYLNKAQITSGTLSYAVSGGCAVVSTPYWHAEELLADGLGKLFDFEDSTNLSLIVNQLLENEIILKELQHKAYEFGKTISWPIIGKTYLSLFDQIKKDNLSRPTIPAVGFKISEFDITHLSRLTDSTGLLQHARTSIPYFKTGYCLDDNSRALILCLLAWNKAPSTRLRELMDVYLSYIVLMQQKDGSFKNYLTYERTAFIDDTSDDAFGRAFWALGCLVRYAPNDAMFQLGHEMFNQSVPQLDDIRYARGFANGIFGLYHYCRRFPDQEKFQILLESLAERLCDQYGRLRHENWNWFEESITYDNGLLPASLYLAYEVSRKAKYLQIAEESRLFLESKCFREDWLSLVGNRKWLRMNTDFDHFAQQPVDALAMVIMYESAFSATKNPAFVSKIIKSFQWFTGNNDSDISLIDPESKGCNDGIEEFNINRNQGAESTISYLLSNLIATPYLYD
ncbi:MAG: glycosyltransferase [Bacteroidales bacterium]|nr:glycosyltransferase [Bacteroidales bacterium]